MPGEPATTCTAVCHLWAVAPGPATGAATSASVTSQAEAVASTERPEADVGHLHRPGVLGALAEQQPGL